MPQTTNQPSARRELLRERLLELAACGEVSDLDALARQIDVLL